MTRPLLTIRKLMLALVLLAVALWVGVVAYWVAHQPNSETLSHLRRYRDNNEPFVYSHGVTPGQYWAEVGRRVVGMEWPGRSVCSCKAEHEAEMGKAMVDVETSHDLDALHRRLNEL